MEMEKEQLKVLPLLLAPRWRPLEHLKEMLPNDDPVEVVLQSIFRLGIYGTLVPMRDTKSTLELEKKITRFLKKIYMAAKHEYPVLIVGESGTGKELMVRVIHDVGKGKNKPFGIFDCTRANEESIESELFGHEKGAYTGAVGIRKGCIELAKGGTCFIDEMGKMPLHLQSKLLRVIEYKEFKRLGGSEIISAKDVKFIVALQPGDMDDKEKILPDLRNRLNPYAAINLPSLKEMLKNDPYIIYGVLEKLLKREDMQNHLIGDISRHKNEAKKALENFDKSLEIKDIYAYDQPGHLLKKNQKIMTPKSLVEWNKYFKIQCQISNRENPISLSDEALIKLVKYEGYDGKNFRELESILIDAIQNAYSRDRREILVEDLPLEVRSPQTRVVKKTSEMNIYDVKNIPLRKIIDYSNEIRASILRKKIEEIYQDGKEVKTVLSSEGIKSNSEYTGLRNKLERILGNGSLKQIREQFKK